MRPNTFCESFFTPAPPRVLCPGRSRGFSFLLILSCLRKKCKYRARQRCVWPPHTRRALRGRTAPAPRPGAGATPAAGRAATQESRPSAALCRRGPVSAFLPAGPGRRQRAAPRESRFATAVPTARAHAPLQMSGTTNGHTQKARLGPSPVPVMPINHAVPSA